MSKLNCLLIVTAIGIFVGLLGGSSNAVTRQVTDSKVYLTPPGKGLFRSHEFRGSLKALFNWTRVMASAEAQTNDFYACDATIEDCSAAALSWQKIIRLSQPLAGLEQLKVINSYFNRWPYRPDIDVYGVSDYWATPGQFLRFSGDCEDYCIIKYYALRKLGYPVDDMRIVLLKDNIRNIAHAVLVVKLNDETYVLDNASDLVLPQLKYEHYIPQYSVNESYRWGQDATKEGYDETP